eukprot:3008100-Alexandrium_andersonii.AAC.1
MRKRAYARVGAGACKASGHALLGTRVSHMVYPCSRLGKCRNVPIICLGQIRAASMPSETGLA